MSDIYVIVNRELRLELFRWLEKNTPVNMPNWGLRTRYIYFDGIDNINFLTRPSGKLVTPNEFRSRVKAACWKGER